MSNVMIGICTIGAINSFLSMGNIPLFIGSFILSSSIWTLLVVGKKA